MADLTHRKDRIYRALMHGSARLVAAMLASIVAGCAPLGATHPAASSKASPRTCQAPPAGVRAFEIKPGQAEASYTAQEEITLKRIQELLNISTPDNTAVGRTKQISGEIDLARDNSIVAMKVTADLRTLTSDNGLRDDRIRTEFLESNRYPWAVFTAAGAQTVSGPYGEGAEVTFAVPGQLTVREITKPFTFAVVGSLTGSTIRGIASGSVRMADFGFDPPVIPGAIQVKEGLALRVTFTAGETRCTQLRG